MTTLPAWRRNGAMVAKAVGAIALVLGVGLFVLKTWGPELGRTADSLALSGLVCCVGAWLGIGKGLAILLTGRLRVSTILGKAEGGGLEVYALGATFSLVGLGVLGLGLMLSASTIFGF